MCVVYVSHGPGLLQYFDIVILFDITLDIFLLWRRLCWGGYYLTVFPHQGEVKKYLVLGLVFVVLRGFPLLVDFLHWARGEMKNLYIWKVHVHFFEPEHSITNFSLEFSLPLEGVEHSLGSIPIAAGYLGRGPGSDAKRFLSYRTFC